MTFNKKYNIKFDEKFWINIDWDLWIKLSENKGSFLYVKKKLVGHRIHNKSETTRAIKDGKEKKKTGCYLKIMAKTSSFGFK